MLGSSAAEEEENLTGVVGGSIVLPAAVTERGYLSHEGKIIASVAKDPAPTPAVETQTVSSDSCWLICSVDKQASLLWIKDQDILNQSRSALSLPVTVRKEDRGSSYRCVAANPAENKTLHVNVTTSCGFNDTESLDNFEKRTYWIAGGICSVFLALVVVGVWVIKQRYLSKKKPVRQTQEEKKKAVDETRLA